MLSRKLQLILNILDGRSSIYSHRPKFIMAGELLCNGIMLSLIPYGDLCVLILWVLMLHGAYSNRLKRFRRMRRATHDTFSPRPAEQFRPLQEKESVRLVSELLQNPGDWESILQK